MVPDPNCTAHESPTHRSILHSQCASKVVVGESIIGFQADGFLELADRLVHLAFPGKGDTKVAVDLGVIGFQADDFPELPDRLVDLACVQEGVAERIIDQPGRNLGVRFLLPTVPHPMSGIPQPPPASALPATTQPVTSLLIACC